MSRREKISFITPDDYEVIDNNTIAAVNARIQPVIDKAIRTFKRKNEESRIQASKLILNA